MIGSGPHYQSPEFFRPGLTVIRFLPWFTVVVTSILCGIAAARGSAWGWGLVLTVPLALIGLRDWFQHRHTLTRNYPVVGHLRWMLESIGPHLRQYFFDDDLQGAPYNREQKSVVYARAKGDNDFEPFGTEKDVLKPGFEWINHAIVPAERREPSRVRIGSGQCDKPYEASLLNISAMSFGSLSGRAIKALNAGARDGGFAHDTGEGGISVYHRHGGDLVWELGSGYFGCRTKSGEFDAEQFAETASDAQVRMVSIKLSQGAKAGHGGILPGSKVSREIAEARGVQPGEACVSPSRHSAFSTPLELIIFANRLRELSGGKPVGIKLCIGHPWEFLGICKAMLETGIFLDFVIVDGKEGGTGAAPEEFSDNVGTPLRDGLLFARNALVGSGLRDQVRIVASGKIVTGFDMARSMALGADLCNAARTFMFALGCVQSRRCHLNTCPTGVATQDHWRQRGLDIDEKAQRVRRYQSAACNSLMDLVAAAGLESPADIRPRHILHRLSASKAESFADLYGFLDNGELGNGARDPWYREQWSFARAGSFALA
jgi:glutamate synthase domain-containing protein 2